MGEDKSTVVILIIGAILLVYWLTSQSEQTPRRRVKKVNNVNEQFDISPYESSKELDHYYEDNTNGIENYLVDNMTCDPSCCGDQWPVPFDGMTAAEINQSIENRGSPGPFVRTNHTCGNGINGVGCPCINKKAYKFIVNHGQNAHNITEIEPTFLINRDVVKPYDLSNESSPYEQLQYKKSMFVDKPMLNDLELRRPAENINNVQSYGSPILTKDKQIEKIY